jgi:CubicO group peptidase (beta-lactamase class C family)
MSAEYLPGAPATGAVPIVPDPVTGAIPIVNSPEFDEVAPVTGTLPVVAIDPVTGAVPVVQDVATGAIPAIRTEAPQPAAPPHPPLDEWQFEPYIRWSMRNIEAFLPVGRIRRGSRTSDFERRRSDIGTLSVAHPWEDRAASFSEVMQSTFTDGWMVVHRGTIVAEEYLDEFSLGGMHLLMSVSKSLTATVAGQLAASGELDLDRPVTEYVPQLAGSGYDGSLVRHLVDMRTGVAFSEEYLNDDAEVRLLEQAIGWAPKRHPEVPDTLLGFLATLGQKAPHGGPFDYKSCETDALGFVIESAAGRHTAEVMSERLWAPMGAEFDAHVGIDSVGAGMFDGGVSAAMRDLARFGHLFVNKGSTVNDVPVLSEWWVDDTFEGESDSRKAFADAPEPTFMPGGMYRNGFWFPGESSDVMLALGIHGQMIYINRATCVVGVKVSSWPTPQDAEKLFWTVRAFEAASWALDRGAA